MLRLYPIRYRHLQPAQQFDRFDLVEMLLERPRDDSRPESCHVDESSIKVLSQGKRVSSESKVNLWRPFVASSLKALHAENKEFKRSLGIVKPDTGSLKFFVRPSKEVAEDDRAMTAAAFAFAQPSLIEAPLASRPKPDYSFGYRFKSGGNSHEHLIHDWEVQAAYIAYRSKYGDQALDYLKKEYEHEIPRRNLHFILGTMKAHPQTFIIIGLLRSGTDPDTLPPQLF